MAPHENRAQSSAISSIRLTAYKKFPTNYPHKTFEQWLSAKRTDDGVGPYWRIHNKLYDLSDFADHHPGGKTWIEITRGTDITEAFESSHISDTPEKQLKKFYVKDISTPRNSPYTFHEDGFYKTFKRKVRPVLKKIGRGPSWKSVLIQDGLGFAFVVLTFSSVILSSYTLAVLAGIALTLTVTCAHNFFHQHDNWRMFYFDLSFFTSHGWRVTHALSHHLYTNTANDIEMSSVEPFVVLLPKPDKTFLQRYGSYIYELVLMPFLPLMAELLRVVEVCTKRTALRPEYLLPYFELLVMTVISPSFWMALKLFVTIHATFNILFMTAALTVAHHHPDIFHDGDRMREDPDWGLCQLDAVRDRMELQGNLFLVLTSFGDHTLHHLLPTIDHSKLNSLYPVFFETCKEFKIPFSFTTWPNLVVGKYLQMANNTPNTNYPGFKPKAS